MARIKKKQQQKHTHTQIFVESSKKEDKERKRVRETPLGVWCVYVTLTRKQIYDHPNWMSSRVELSISFNLNASHGEWNSWVYTYMQICGLHVTKSLCCAQVHNIGFNKQLTQPYIMQIIWLYNIIWLRTDIPQIYFFESRLLQCQFFDKCNCWGSEHWNRLAE